MQVNRWELLLCIAAFAIAGVSVFFTGNIWFVALAAGVFAMTIVLSYRQSHRELYLLAAGEPLAVTVGITNPSAGILIQLVLIGILLAEDIEQMEVPVRLGLLVIPGAVTVFALFTMSVSDVFVPFLVLLISSAVCAFLINVQNRTLKIKYSGE